MKKYFGKTGIERVYGKDHLMREGSIVPDWPVNFVFNSAGIGDFLNYSAATTWIARNNPWVQGRLFCRELLVPIMREIHKEYGHWSVYPIEEKNKYWETGTAFLGPDILVHGQNVTPLYLGVNGAHPIDVACAMYAGISPAPNDCQLPVLDFKINRFPKLKEKLPNRFAVIPTGFTAESRRLHGRHLNPVLENLVSLGITPVFVGKKNLLSAPGDNSSYSQDINYSFGLDLREQTNLMECAYLCQHAEMTLGLDCGVLHLAALMKDSKIIFGYNITTVEHRKPRRLHGTTIDVALDKSELICIGCQSNWKMHPTYEADKCAYSDTKCVDILFENEGERFKRAIAKLLVTSAAA